MDIYHRISSSSNRDIILRKELELEVRIDRMGISSLRMRVGMGIDRMGMEVGWGGGDMSSEVLQGMGSLRIGD